MKNSNFPYIESLSPILDNLTKRANQNRWTPYFGSKIGEINYFGTRIGEKLSTLDWATYIGQNLDWTPILAQYRGDDANIR